MMTGVSWLDQQCNSHKVACEIYYILGRTARKILILVQLTHLSLSIILHPILYCMAVAESLALA
jgi:hypothetical protein